MIEILFLIGFLIHNHAEEPYWFPEWSENAGKFHKTVTKSEFYFAAVAVSTIGILFTFQYLIFGNSCILSKYIFLGFVSMMVLNSIFPHLAATIILRKYCPGLLTGMLLNFPIGTYIITKNISSGKEFAALLVSTVAVSIFSILIIIPSFKFGKTLEKMKKNQ